jgi:UDP-N-acetyl-D-galactosamine dehydrogenase
MSLMLPSTTCCLAVIGLGYVGLPLAVNFANQESRLASTNHVLGFDINRQRLEQLAEAYDITNELSDSELANAKQLIYTSDESSLTDADVFIVTVPTPIDSAKKPNLQPLQNASLTVGRVLRERHALRPNAPSPVVIYESTVYPGTTEDFCVPLIEAESSLVHNLDFFTGYSPERINPGDRERRLPNITKVTSGSTPEVASWIDALYSSIIPAGTYRASSIMVAEAAKVIENTQRDLNIALINELTIIFKKLGIDTLDVLEAASTKWNFLPFKPGLVGGHCIGVDPYYLTYKAEQLGYYPQVVLAGRRINDGMGNWIIDQLILKFAKTGQVIRGSKVLICGLTFKENCPDLRNTRVVDLVKALNDYEIYPDIVDPYVSQEAALNEYGLSITNDIPFTEMYDAIIVAVSHSVFEQITKLQWLSMLRPNSQLMDLKGILPRDIATWRP